MGEGIHEQQRQRHDANGHAMPRNDAGHVISTPVAMRRPNIPDCTLRLPRPGQPEPSDRPGCCAHDDLHLRRGLRCIHVGAIPTKQHRHIQKRGGASAFRPPLTVETRNNNSNNNECGRSARFVRMLREAVLGPTSPMHPRKQITGFVWHNAKSSG